MLIHEFCCHEEGDRGRACRIGFKVVTNQWRRLECRYRWWRQEGSRATESGYRVHGKKAAHGKKFVQEHEHGHDHVNEHNCRGSSQQQWPSTESVDDSRGQEDPQLQKFLQESSTDNAENADEDIRHGSLCVSEADLCEDFHEEGVYDCKRGRNR